MFEVNSIGNYFYLVTYKQEVESLFGFKRVKRCKVLLVKDSPGAGYPGDLSKLVEELNKGGIKPA